MEVQDVIAQARGRALTVKQVFVEPAEGQRDHHSGDQRPGRCGRRAGEDPQSQARDRAAAPHATARPVGAFIIREAS